jgi:hypothetical protein
MVSPQAAARDIAEAGVTRILTTIAVIPPSIALVQVLASAHSYRLPALAVAVWLAVLGAAAWLLPRMRAGRLSAGETAAAIAIAVVAVALVGLARQSHANPGSVDLAMLGTVWLLVLVAVSRSPWIWVPAALAVLAVHCALIIWVQGLHRLSLSDLAVASYIVAAMLTAFAALRPTLAVHVSLAARRSSLASRTAAERVATAAISQERRSRLAVLEGEVLPLLRGIADGTLDPAAPDVRGQCERHAALLRHSLTSRLDGGPLTAGLEPALRAAGERGLLVDVQLIGDPGTPPPALASALLATVDAVLAVLPPHQVTLTVLAAGEESEDAELYLTFDAALPNPPDLARLGQHLPATARWHAAVIAADTGGGYLEISWRKDGAW